MSLDKIKDYCSSLLSTGKESVAVRDLIVVIEKIEQEEEKLKCIFCKNCITTELSDLPVSVSANLLFPSAVEENNSKNDIEIKLNESSNPAVLISDASVGKRRLLIDDEDDVIDEIRDARLSIGSNVSTRSNKSTASTVTYVDTENPLEDEYFIDSISNLDIECSEDEIFLEKEQESVDYNIVVESILYDLIEEACTEADKIVLSNENLELDTSFGVNSEIEDVANECDEPKANESVAQSSYIPWDIALIADWNLREFSEDSHTTVIIPEDITLQSISAAIISATLRDLSTSGYEALASLCNHALTISNLQAEECSLSHRQPGSVRFHPFDAIPPPNDRVLFSWKSTERYIRLYELILDDLNTLTTYGYRESIVKSSQCLQDQLIGKCKKCKLLTQLCDKQFLTEKTSTELVNLFNFIQSSLSQTSAKLSEKLEFLIVSVIRSQLRYLIGSEPENLTVREIALSSVRSNLASKLVYEEAENEEDTCEIGLNVLVSNSLQEFQFVMKEIQLFSGSLLPAETNGQTLNTLSRNWFICAMENAMKRSDNSYFQSIIAASTAQEFLSKIFSLIDTVEVDKVVAETWVELSANCDKLMKYVTPESEHFLLLKEMKNFRTMIATTWISADMLQCCRDICSEEMVSSVFIKSKLDQWVKLTTTNVGKTASSGIITSFPRSASKQSGKGTAASNDKENSHVNITGRAGRNKTDVVPQKAVDKKSKPSVQEKWKATCRQNDIIVEYPTVIVK